MCDLKQYIRSVPDFPKKGINFYDITTLLVNADGFRMAVDQLADYVRSRSANKIVAVESRGFLFGAPICDRLGMGIVPVRKKGKLPAETISEEYSLEYGKDKLEIHSDAVSKGDRIVIVDDLIATGGSVRAVCNLVERLGGEVVGIGAIIDLSFLPWREKLAGYDVKCLISYDSE